MAPTTPAPLNANATLAAARLLARRQRPYFTHALLALIPYESPGLGTMAVTKHFVLMWDPAAVLSWGVERTAAVLLHEIEHPLRKHHERMAAIGATGTDLANIATDAEINDDIIAGGSKLPDEPVTPSRLGLPDGRLAEEYYNLLRQKQEQQPPPPPGPGPVGDGPPGGKPNPGGKPGNKPSNKPSDKPQDANKPGGQGKPEGDPQGGSTGQGSGEGNEDGLSSNDDGAGQGDLQDSDAGSSNGKPGNEDGKAKAKPKCPGSGKCGSGAGKAHEAEAQLPPDIGRSPADAERVRRQTAERIRQAASSGKGDVPGGLMRWADEQLKPPKVAWQSKLARLARRAVTYKAGATDYRRDRVARRQAALGFNPGTPLLPALRSPVPKVAVVIDTSGSMGTKELQRAISETASVLRAAQSIEFLASDAKVHEVKKVRTVKEAHKLLVGGGGTDFRPVFTALDKAKQRPDIVVFITDGIGPAPVQPPKEMHTIWLLVGESRRKPYADNYGGGSITWGEFIEVDD